MRSVLLTFAITLCDVAVSLLDLLLEYASRPENRNVFTAMRPSLNQVMTHESNNQ